MRELRDLLGHSVVLTARTPRGPLVLNTIQGTSTIEIGVRVGSELTFHGSAQGKILLAFAPRPQQERVLSRSLQRFTTHTVAEPKLLEEELSRVVQLGFATAPEQSVLGINAVAAPIFDEKDACIAAVALVGSIQFLPADPDPASISALKVAAEQISRKLGHSRAESQMHLARRRTA